VVVVVVLLLQVLAIGSGVTLKLSVGDKVVFNKYAMAEVEVPDGDILFCGREEHSREAGSEAGVKAGSEAGVRSWNEGCMWRQGFCGLSPGSLLTFVEQPGGGQCWPKRGTCLREGRLETSPPPCVEAGCCLCSSNLPPACQLLQTSALYRNSSGSCHHMSVISYQHAGLCSEHACH